MGWGGGGCGGSDFGRGYETAGWGVCSNFKAPRGGVGRGWVGGRGLRVASVRTLPGYLTPSHQVQVAKIYAK